MPRKNIRLIPLLATLGAITGISSASAADLAARPYTKAAVAPMAGVYSWTGFYIGAQVGWSEVRDSQVMTSPTLAPLALSSRADGVVGGGHVGYNLQTGQFVFGVEGDIEANSASGSYLIPPPLVQPANGTQRLDWQGSVRGRLGLTVDRVLFYGTGGWAFGHFTDGYFTPGTPFNETVSSTRDGWTAGAGIEYAMASNWTVRAEYRYTDWGKHTNVLNTYLAPAGTSVDEVTEHTARIGISYKFGGPVVAKY